MDEPRARRALGTGCEGRGWEASGTRGRAAQMEPGTARGGAGAAAAWARGLCSRSPAVLRLVTPLAVGVSVWKDLEGGVDTLRGTCGAAVLPESGQTRGRALPGGEEAGSLGFSSDLGRGESHHAGWAAAEGLVRRGFWKAAASRAPQAGGWVPCG